MSSSTRADGVVCGHIHWAAIRDADGVTYVNCGDWVDSCTAIVEHHDGRLELVHWHGPTGVSEDAAPARSALPQPARTHGTVEPARTPETVHSAAADA